jgi:diguanylate cyclase (GGDEF)-like protein
MAERAMETDTDSLTQLPNRDYMCRKLSQELGRSFGDRSRAIGERPPVCVSLLDLDGFKGVNDTLGHLEGDGVLSRAADRFVASLHETMGPMRMGDEIGRWGGDEFVMVLPATKLPDGCRAMERIRQRIEAAKEGEQTLHGVTVSAGVTTSDAVGVPLLYGENGRELLRRYADAEREGKPTLKSLIGFSAYLGMSGMPRGKVAGMLRNVYRFLEATKRDVDSVGINFEEFAVSIMLRNADEALYDAKRNGRNRVHAYGEEGLGRYEGGLWVPSARASSMISV